MRVEKLQVSAFIIHDAPALDPITVITQELGLGKGKITIECFGESWSAYWGAMGQQNINEFFAICHYDYLVTCLGNGFSEDQYAYLSRIVIAVQDAIKQGVPA